MDRSWRLGLVVALASFLCGGCGGSASLPDPGYLPSSDVSALGRVETEVFRLLDSMDAAAAASPDRARAHDSPCRARVSGHGHPIGALPAMPAECSIHEAQEETRAALRTVQRALLQDLVPVVARLQRLSRKERLGEDQWLLISDPVMRPTVTHLTWMVEALRKSHDLTESADPGWPNEGLWLEAARQYERALLGAQVLSVWMSWLDFAKQLHARTTLDPERIMGRLWSAWQDFEPVLNGLDAFSWQRVQRTAESLPTRLPELSRALADWGEEVEHDLRESAELVDTLLLIQAGFEILSMRRAVSPLVGRGARAAYVITLPGIGGVTAGGAALGVRVVVGTEWLEAIRHLVAIGAITSVEVAKLAGIAVITGAPTPRPNTSATWQRVGQTGSAAGGASAGAGSRPVQAVVQHRGGHHQVVVDGQRWHVPWGKTPDDIPAADPVGDRLQAVVDDIAPRWSPAKLSPAAKEAIKDALAAGKPWQARLLERQARGRWVEKGARDKLPELQWHGRSVDAVDPRTGIQYEVLSGTRDNLDLHANRMPNELFRMITF